MRKTIPYTSILKYLIKINILWSVIAPLVLALITMVFSNSSIFILKDIIFYFSFILIFFLPNRFFNISDKIRLLLYILGFLLFLLITTFLLHSFHSWQVYNVRQFLAPIMIVSFLSFVKIPFEFNKRMILFILKVVVSLILIGFIFQLINIWEFINLSNFFQAKGIPTYDNGTPAMFFEPSMNYAPRLVSVILDPISFGHIITAAFVSLFFLKVIKKNRRKLYFFILIVGLFLTMSKGAIFQLVICVFLFNPRLNIFLRLAIPLSTLVAGFFLIDLKGIIIHFLGFYSALINANLFGHGLGMVGNYAKMFAGDLTIYHKMGISDTFIGSVLGQIGILGLFFWASFFYKYFIDLTRGIIMPGSIIIVSQLIISVLSENTLNLTSFFIPGLLAVLVNKYQLYENSNTRN